MQKDGEWGDCIMLSVTVKLYGRPIVLLSPEAEEESTVQHIDQSTSSANDGPLIYLVFFNHLLRRQMSVMYLEKTRTARLGKFCMTLLHQISASLWRLSSTILTKDCAHVNLV